MMRDEVLAAARQFLELLSAPPAPEEREPALRKALDVLALAYHYPEASTEARESVSVREPGLAKHEHLCERYRTLFPDFGHYNTTWDHWENIGAGEVTIGDAIDDQADITLDVQESVDRWGQTSPEDALTSFRSSFEYHWGRHLRSLQLYLHMRAYYRFDDDE